MQNKDSVTLVIIFSDTCNIDLTADSYKFGGKQHSAFDIINYFFNFGYLEKAG